MSRNLSAAVTSISQLASVRYRLLCEVFSLSTGTTRACTGNNFVQFNGNTYSPVGLLGGVDPIQEESDIFPRAVKIWFAAVNTSVIQDVLNENMFNKPAKIFRTFLTDSYTCVATPELVFNGKINTCDMKLKDPERGDYFEIEVESKLARNARSLYFNRETLAITYAQSGNALFDFVTRIPFVKANWGGMSVGGNGFRPSGPTPGTNLDPDTGRDTGGGRR
jgi:hypothetical protein